MQPNPQSAADSAATSVEKQSLDAFYRDLPRLLKMHYWKWVAYHGDQLICVGRTQTELYKKCLRDGLKEDEFIVRFVSDMALSDHEEINIPDV